ncbi:hypothetical protein M5E89_01240 [Acidaminococcus intestini]|nr:hypothetical protein M5E89_01240 [Acidaminococcus intestini]
MKESNLSVLLGAAFLMATSAIGPGFLTQTTVFTSQLKGSFGFVILVTIIIHAITQLNVWRIIAVSKNQVRILPTQSCRVLATSFRPLSLPADLPSTSAILAVPVSV